MKFVKCMDDNYWDLTVWDYYKIFDINKLSRKDVGNSKCIRQIKIIDNAGNRKFYSLGLFVWKIFKLEAWIYKVDKTSTMDIERALFKKRSNRKATFDSNKREHTKSYCQNLNYFINN